MIAVQYIAGQWRDFFVMVGGAAAALTGLVFVALSLNVALIVRDATHRYRAIGTLSGFVSAFSVCALALAGSGNRVWVGVEWIAVSAAAGAIYLRGYREAVRGGGAADVLSVRRTVLGASTNAVQVLGAALLASGVCAGIYVAAVALVAYFWIMVSGAWLLIVGVNRPGSAPGAAS